MVREPGIYPPPTPTTPSLAPWDAVQELCNKLDRLIAIMEVWTGLPPAEPGAPPGMPGWEPIIAKLEQIRAAIAALEVTVTTPWVGKPAEEIYRRAIRTTGTFYCDKMLNWIEGKRLLLMVISTLDQAVQIQAMGNITPAKEGSVDINAALPCAARGKISIGFAWDDWHPYIGCKIIVAAMPTTGELQIQAVVQE